MACYLLCALFLQFAHGQTEHTLVRRLSVFPIKAGQELAPVAEEVWWELRETMTRVLPKHRMIPVPPDHPIFDSFYKIDLRLLEQSDYGVMTYWGIFQDNDPKKRLMAIANLNGDLGEFWQWEARGYNIAPTNEAYKLGVNYLVYALTH